MGLEPATICGWRMAERRVTSCGSPAGGLVKCCPAAAQARRTNVLHRHTDFEVQATVSRSAQAPNPATSGRQASHELHRARLKVNRDASASR